MNVHELSAILSKKVIDHIDKQGDRFTVYYTDKTSLIILDNAECMFCKAKNIETPLCTLDNEHYICINCTERCLELFGAGGIPIDLNLEKINPKLAENFRKIVNKGKIEK